MGSLNSSMKTTWLLVLILMTIMTAAFVSADEVSGTSWARIPYLKDDSGLELDWGATILVNWKVWTLFDEPVVDSTAAWNVWEWTSIRRLPSWVKRYKGSLEIPEDVLKKIRLFNVELFGEVWSREGLMLDVGVFTQPMIHTYGLGGIETPDWSIFKNGTPEDQAGFFSFNVPGSPSWKNLFKTESGNLGVLGVKTEDAKAMVKQGFNLGTYENELKILKMGVDLSAIHDWLWQKEREAVEMWEAEIVQEKTRLAEQDAERKKAEESDFWGTPADTETVEDRAARQTLEWELELIEERNRELDEIKTAIEKETSKVDMIIEAKLKALKELGTVSATIVDAMTGQGLGGVIVRVLGFTEYSTTSSSNGYFTIGVPSGTRQLTFQRDGYTIPSVSVWVGAKTTTNIPQSSIIANSEVPLGNLRVVLTWAYNPKDLDLHLTTPNGHNISYDNKHPTGSGANLDLDDTSSYGPETITITSMQSGTYKFYVHNYSSTGALVTSEAKVRVFDNSGLIRTFMVPTSGSGDYWQVFNYNGGSISAINIITTWSQ